MADKRLTDSPEYSEPKYMLGIKSDNTIIKTLLADLFDRFGGGEFDIGG